MGRIPEAIGFHVWVIRDDKKRETSEGFAIPGNAQKKPNTGKIVSVGTQAFNEDNKLKKDKTAIFHKQSGSDVDFEEEKFVLLRLDQVLGVV